MITNEYDEKIKSNRRDSKKLVKRSGVISVDWILAAFHSIHKTLLE
jgi:hypothetical protein